MGALGEVDDGLDPSERRFPLGRRGNVAEHQRLGPGQRHARTPHASDDLMAVRGKRRAQRRPNKARRAGDEDARHDFRFALANSLGDRAVLH